MVRVERLGARLSAPRWRRFGTVSGVIIASLMLLAWDPVAAVNPGSDEVLQEGNSPPSVDVPDDLVGIWLVSTMFKATCTDLDAADQLRLTWYWGDGTLSVTNHQSNGGNLTALTAHTFRMRQYYTLTVWIDDQTGLPDHNVSDQGFVCNIPLGDYPPVIASFTVNTPTPMTEQLVTFSATVTDLNYDGCVVAFEFGDGTSIEVTQPLPNWTVSVQHTYLAPGVFSAFAYAFDGYVFSCPSEPIVIEVTYPSFSLALVHGWNLICNPLVNGSISASMLGLRTDDVVSGWNSSSKAYDKNYIVNRSPSRNDFEIEESTGYWIYVGVAETLRFNGAIPTTSQTRTITVPTGGGWVIVGFESLTTTRNASDIPKMYSGGVITVVAVYNTTTGLYKVYIAGVAPTDFSLLPGQACWLYCSASGVLTYDP